LELKNSFSVLGGPHTIDDDSIASADSSFHPTSSSSPRSEHCRRSSKSDTQDVEPSQTDHKIPKQGTNNWRTLIVNCEGIKSKQAQFAAAVDYIKPDAIMGCESKLDSSIHTAEKFPPEYKVYRKDRDIYGGGVFIAIKDCYISEALNDADADAEIIWAKVTIDNAKPLVIGSFYRPPGDNVAKLENLGSSLDNLQKSCKDKTIHLGGDFNAPGIDWESNSVTPTAYKPGICKKLLDIQDENLLSQLQYEPTRESNNLDLFFTNNPSLVKTIQTCPGIGDHNMVTVDCDIKPLRSKSKPRQVPQYNKVDWATIKEEALNLQTTILDSDFDSRTTESNWTLFKNGLLLIIKRCIPYKNCKSSSHLPWISDSIKRAINKKQRLFYIMKKKSTSNSVNRYKKQKLAVSKLLRLAHRKYISNILNTSLQDNNHKPFWKYIKSQKTDNLGVSPIRHLGRLFSEPKDKAQLLNNQFKSVFTQEDTTNIPPMPGEHYPSIPDLVIDEAGVKTLLDRINPNKAHGPDAIPNRVLKEASSELAPILTAIFRQSVKTAVLPLDWRNAFITPIFKKGDRHATENYRPISLTCVCCKLLEHIICKHVLLHLDDHNILTKTQHGFRKGHSCESQLIITAHELLKLSDRKTQVDIAVLDFSKAFDTVPHHRLLEKLKHYGVDANIHAWIRAFLCDRSQQVLVEGESSNSVTVDSGVPQGTVLGPLLFLLHINDLPDTVTSSVRLFADDCLLFRPINSIQDQHELQHDLSRLQSWAKTWGMQFNSKKCYILRTTRCAKQLSYYYEIGGHILQEVASTPYLGVTFANTLKWDVHICSIANNANKMLGFVKRNLRHAPQSLKAIAYKSLVRSKLEYSSSVWDPHLVKNKSALENVQRRAARFVCNDYSRYSSVTNMLQSLGWPLLEQRRKEKRIHLMSKIIADEIAIPKEDYLTPASRRTRRQNAHKFAVYSANTDEYRMSFFPRTVVDWNQSSQVDVDTICAAAATSRN